VQMEQKAATEKRTGRIGQMSSNAIRSRLLKNSALMMGCRISAMLVSLITVPFVITRLGLSGYGSWEVLLSISTITTIFQNAVGGTLLWKLASAFGAGDVLEIRRLPRLGIFLTGLMCGVTFPLVLLLRVQITTILRIPLELRSSATIILPCIIGVTLLGGINESLAAVLRGSQETGYTYVVMTLAGFVNSAIILFGLWMGKGLWSLLAGYIAIAWITGAGYYLRVSYLYGWFDLRPLFPSRQDLRDTRRYFGLLTVGSFSVLLRGETDKLVLASFASPAWVGVYAIAARMSSLVMESSNFFYAPTIAAAGALNGRKDWPGIRALYAHMASVFPVAAGLMSLLVLSLYDRLCVMWLGRTVPGLAPLLFLVIAGNTVAVVLTGTGTSILKGLGKMELETTYVVLGLILNILLTVVLVYFLGAIGTVIASTASWSLGAALFLVLVHKKFDFPVQGAYLSVATLGYIALLAAAAQMLIPVYGSDPNRLRAFFSAAQYGAIVSAVYILPFLVLHRQVLLERCRRFLLRPANGGGVA